MKYCRINIVFIIRNTVTVLLQVLLLRQRRDKDELKCDCDTACVVIWQRVVNTLVKAVLSPSPPHHDQEVEGEGAWGRSLKVESVGYDWTGMACDWPGMTCEGLLELVFAMRENCHQIIFLQRHMATPRVYARVKMIRGVASVRDRGVTVVW